MADFRFTNKTYDELCNLCRLGDADRFKAIVDAVSDEEKSRFGPTTFSSPLIAAARCRNTDIVQYLIETFPNAIDINDDCRITENSVLYLMTPLVAACSVSSVCHGMYSRKSNLNIVKYLVEKGADINQATFPNGTTPLMAAVSCNDQESFRVVQYLIDNGADVNEINDFYSENCLLVAVAQNRHEHFPALIRAGVDVHHSNIYGYTALHVACMRVGVCGEGPSKSVKTLLENGCPPLFAPSTYSAHPGYVPCPLYIAAASGNRENVQLFIKQGRCPPECVADAYLLLAIHLCKAQHWHPMARPRTHIYNYIKNGLKCLHKHKITLSCPPPRPDFNYQVELRTKEELDAVWGTDEFMNVGLTFQCVLIAERCLGPKSLLLADILEKFEIRFIMRGSRQQYSTEAEKLMKLRLKTLVSFYSHLHSQANDYYFFRIQEASKHMRCLITNLGYMIGENYSPNFSDYIQFELQLLEYLPVRTNEYHNAICEVLNLFSLWFQSAGVEGISTDTSACHDGFFPLLKLFVERYLYYCKESTVLFIALEAVFTEPFIEAILKAGGVKAINCANRKGQRPLHVAASGHTREMLMKYGAHIDAVNSKGETAFPRGTFGVPSLYCTVANAIVQYSLPYQSIGLPSHVVQFIMLHDQSAT